MGFFNWNKDTGVTPKNAFNTISAPCGCDVAEGYMETHEATCKQCLRLAKDVGDHDDSVEDDGTIETDSGMSALAEFAKKHYKGKD